MTRIDDIFRSLRAEGRPALMPFVTAGYPTMDATAATILALEDAGASIVEIGFPFSDPIADGPVIAASMHEALLAGATPDAIFDAIDGIRSSTRLGLIAMVSASIVYRDSPDQFMTRAKKAGIDGLIIPDLDTASAENLVALADQHDLSFSLLVAPNSSAERIREIVASCRGFVYVLARLGLTGEQQQLPDVARHVANVRAETDLPIAVGFGISTPEHVAAVTGAADAAIVGSALVRRMGDSDDPVEGARAFVKELATGLQSR